LTWNKPSNNFKNKKFKGDDIAWKDLCFAGEDAKIDPRTKSPACLGDGASYASPIKMFTDRWKFLIGPAEA